MTRKHHIGDVLICPTEQGNPYHGSLIGPPRKAALLAFREGKLDPTLCAWYAPCHGGARRCTADEVDWSSSGLPEQVQP